MSHRNWRRRLKRLIGWTIVHIALWAAVLTLLEAAYEQAH